MLSNVGLLRLQRGRIDCRLLQEGGRYPRAVVTDYEIVFIDDSSTDRTWEIAQGFVRDNPRIRAYRNDRNRNIGFSFKRGVSLAEKEYLLWQTIDWSYDLSDLRIFLELLEHFGVVVGVRPVPIRLAGLHPGRALHLSGSHPVGQFRSRHGVARQLLRAAHSLRHEGARLPEHPIPPHQSAAVVRASGRELVPRRRDDDPRPRSGARSDRGAHQVHSSCEGRSARESGCRRSGRAAATLPRTGSPGGGVSGCRGKGAEGGSTACSSRPS